MITASTPGMPALAGVDLRDPRMRKRTADDVEIDHSRQLDVIDIMAFAAEEPWILFTLDRVPHTSDFRAWFEAPSCYPPAQPGGGIS